MEVGDGKHQSCVLHPELLLVWFLIDSKRGCRKSIQAIIVKLSEMSRKLPLLKSFWIIMHNIMRRKFAIKLNPKQEQCDLRTESIRYLIHRAKELM